MPKTDWKQVCAACAEGTPPERCAYYGDPNGCNAPTLGAHPEGNLAERLQEALEKADRRIAELERAPGNAAAMREALKESTALLAVVRGDEYEENITRQIDRNTDVLSAPPEPPSNAAVLRAALSDLVYNIEIRAAAFDIFSIVDKKTWLDAKAALAAPARNCDVGTAEEQAHRFHAFCSDNTSEIEGMCNSTCPCFDCVDKCHCLCVWSQMPFVPALGGRE